LWGQENTVTWYRSLTVSPCQTLKLSGDISDVL